MMTTVDLAATLAAIARLRAAAEQVSRALHASMAGADPATRGALHRLSVVLRDTVTAIDHLRTAV
jgi:hypothetical protein